MSARLISSHARAPRRLLYHSCISGSQSSSGLKSSICFVFDLRQLQDVVILMGVNVSSLWILLVLDSGMLEAT
eukprot:6281234-Prorocentrum_lima.AAC.1